MMLRVKFKLVMLLCFLLVATGANTIAIAGPDAIIEVRKELMSEPTVGAWLDGAEAHIVSGAEFVDLMVTLIIINAHPSTSYQLISQQHVVAVETSSEGGLVAFFDVDSKGLVGLEVKSVESGFRWTIVPPGASSSERPPIPSEPYATPDDFSVLQSACDISTFSGSSVDNSVRVAASIYRPWCDFSARLEIAGSSAPSNINGICQRGGFNGDFSYNSQVVYSWVHYGDPESLPTSGGGDLADCDGAFHGYVFWPNLDCGVGDLILIYYADYGVISTVSETAGTWPSVSPCLPS